MFARYKLLVNIDNVWKILYWMGYHNFINHSPVVEFLGDFLFCTIYFRLFSSDKFPGLTEKKKYLQGPSCTHVVPFLYGGFQREYGKGTFCCCGHLIGCIWSLLISFTEVASTVPSKYLLDGMGHFLKWPWKLSDSYIQVNFLVCKTLLQVVFEMKMSKKIFTFL